MKLRLPGAMLIALAALTAPHICAAQTYVLDDFETGTSRIVQPKESETSGYKRLWSILFGNPMPTITSAANFKYQGNYALYSPNVSGVSDWQMTIYPYTVGLSGWPDGWQYIRKFVNNPNLDPNGGTPAWPLNSINRLKFWIYLPAGISFNSVKGNHNFEFGTFIRDISAPLVDGESNNQHYYHFFDFESSGTWEQVIVDNHPSYQRQATNSGGVKEYGLEPQAANPGYNYFDLMTRFYLDFPYNAKVGDYYVDDFEYYTEKYPEDVLRIRSLHAYYQPGTNKISVGWSRQSQDVSLVYEVRYAFSDIHASGWDAATAAPSGSVTGGPDGDYSTVKYSTTAINVSGKPMVYIAIKATGQTTFRQIAIPTTGKALPLPNPPTDITVK